MIQSAVQLGITLTLQDLFGQFAENSTVVLDMMHLLRVMTRKEGAGCVFVNVN